MKKLSRALLVLSAGLVSEAAAAAPSDPPSVETTAPPLATRAAFEPLFDGETLGGWHLMQVPEGHNYHGLPGNFYVEDGAIYGAQLPNENGALLLTDRTFGDFELELDFQVDWGCDSGVFIRCTEDGKAIQILLDYLSGGSVGFVYGSGIGGFISRPIVLHENDGQILARESYDGVAIDKLVYAMDAATWNATFKPGEWNTLKVRCVGAEPMITTWINGEKLMEMDGSVFAARHMRDANKQAWEQPSTWDSEATQKILGRRGSIGLQVHPMGGWNSWKPGGTARYRNIRVLDLDPE